MIRLRRLSLLLLSLMMITMLTASGASAANEAKVRVFHASPDAPAVDVYVNGARAVEGLAFESATGYLSLAPGSYRVQVVPAGAALSAGAVIDATLTLEANTSYTVAAVGKVAQIKPAVFVDNNGAPAAGNAHIRVIHASPDAPAVDVAVTGGPVLMPNLAFPNASDYTPVPAATYNLEVRAAGTSTVALPIPGLTVQAGKVYTVFAVGELGAGTLKVVPVVDADHSAVPTAAPAAGMGGTNSTTTPWTTVLGLVIAGGAFLLLRPRFATR